MPIFKNKETEYMVCKEIENKSPSQAILFVSEEEAKATADRIVSTLNKHGFDAFCSVYSVTVRDRKFYELRAKLRIGSLPADEDYHIYDTFSKEEADKWVEDFKRDMSTPEISHFFKTHISVEKTKHPVISNTENNLKDEIKRKLRL